MLETTKCLHYSLNATNLFPMFQSKYACREQRQNNLQNGRKKRPRQVAQLIQDLRHHSQKSLLFL